MAHWTQHSKYSFHVEPVLTPETLAFNLDRLGFRTLCESYVGAWNEGEVSHGVRVTWIAAYGMEEKIEDLQFHLIEDHLKLWANSTCLMPTRECVELRCTCL